MVEGYADKVLEEHQRKLNCRTVDFATANVRTQRGTGPSRAGPIRADRQSSIGEAYAQTMLC